MNIDVYLIFVILSAVAIALGKEKQGTVTIIKLLLICAYAGIGAYYGGNLVCTFFEMRHEACEFSRLIIGASGKYVFDFFINIFTGLSKKGDDVTDLMIKALENQIKKWLQ